MQIKRVIKIDEDLYGRIKDRLTTLGDIPCLFGIVADSKPYDDSGDLISREALKNLTCGIIDEDGNIHQVVMLADIDNAPTVEPRVEYGTDGQPYKLSMTNGKEYARQKGEWVDYDNTFYKCPECGYLLEKCCPQCQNKVILPKGGAE